MRRLPFAKEGHDLERDTGGGSGSGLHASEARPALSQRRAALAGARLANLLNDHLK